MDNGHDACSNGVKCFFLFLLWIFSHALSLLVCRSRFDKWLWNSELSQTRALVGMDTPAVTDASRLMDDTDGSQWDALTNAG